LVPSSEELSRKEREREKDRQREEETESSWNRKIRNTNAKPPETSVPFAMTCWLQYRVIYLLSALHQSTCCGTSLACLVTEASNSL